MHVDVLWYWKLTCVLWAPERTMHNIVYCGFRPMRNPARSRTKKTLSCFNGLKKPSFVITCGCVAESIIFMAGWNDEPEQLTDGRLLCTQLDCRKLGVQGVSGLPSRKSFFSGLRCPLFPFGRFSGGPKEHLVHPVNATKRPFSLDILGFALTMGNGKQGGKMHRAILGGKHTIECVVQSQPVLKASESGIGLVVYDLSEPKRDDVQYGFSGGGARIVGLEKKFQLSVKNASPEEKA